MTDKTIEVVIKEELAYVCQIPIETGKTPEEAAQEYWNNGDWACDGYDDHISYVYRITEKN